VAVTRVSAPYSTLRSVPRCVNLKPCSRTVAHTIDNNGDTTNSPAATAAAVAAIVHMDDSGKEAHDSMRSTTPDSQMRPVIAPITTHPRLSSTPDSAISRGVSSNTVWDATA